MGNFFFGGEKNLAEIFFWRQKFGGKNKFWRQKLGEKNKFGGKISVSNYMFLFDEGNLVILFKEKDIFKNEQYKRLLLQKGSKKW